MAKKRDLTPKQKAFVREYILCRNGSEAARKAGYSKKSADVEAARLLGNASIQTLIQKNDAKMQEKFEITQDKILDEMAAVAFGHIGRVMDWDKDSITMIPKEEMSERDMKFIESIQITETKTDKDTTSTSFKVKTLAAYKVAALEKLGKQIGLFKENGSGSGSNQDARKNAIERIREHLRKRTAKE